MKVLGPVNELFSKVVINLSCKVSFYRRTLTRVISEVTKSHPKYTLQEYLDEL